MTAPTPHATPLQKQLLKTYIIQRDVLALTTKMTGELDPRSTTPPQPSAEEIADAAWKAVLKSSVDSFTMDKIKFSRADDGRPWQVARVDGR